MKQTLGLLIISAVFLTACGGSEPKKPVEKKTVEETYLELADITKACAMEDGEACYKLAQHFEYQNEGAGTPENLKFMMQKQIKETYQKSCNYGYKPACKKAKE